MSLDPHGLCVDIVTVKITADCQTAIDPEDTARLDLIERYDFSGDPTKPDQTANQVVIKPDATIGDYRGFYPEQYSIGIGPSRWACYTVIDVSVYTIRTEDKARADAQVRIGKVVGRIMASLASLARTASGQTEDGHWRIIMPAERYIQAGGPEFSDAGRQRTVRATQQLVVGFRLQYIP